MRASGRPVGRHRERFGLRRIAEQEYARGVLGLLAIEGLAQLCRVRLDLLDDSDLRLVTSSVMSLKSIQGNETRPTHWRPVDGGTYSASSRV